VRPGSATEELRFLNSSFLFRKTKGPRSSILPL
jgi:hypothetical protein